MKTFASAILGTLCLFIVGCGSISNAIDCAGICSRYKDCYDKSYDTATCESRCRNNANADQSYSAKADTCNTCIGAKSCASATFNCPECVGIVP